MPLIDLTRFRALAVNVSEMQLIRDCMDLLQDLLNGELDATNVAAGTVTPAAHATPHQPGGTDAMAVDAAAATGSLRTLGTGAAQAMQGSLAAPKASPTFTGLVTLAGLDLGVGTVSVADGGTSVDVDVAGISYLRGSVSGGAGGGTIAGFGNVAPVGGQTFVISHVNAAGSLTLAHESSTETTAARRILCPSNANLVLTSQMALVVYDADISRWRAFPLLNSPLVAPLVVTGHIVPAQLTANTNDWNPTGLSTATVVSMSTDAARNLTGLAGGADGRIIILRNNGDFTVTLTYLDTNSSTANRFHLVDRVNYSLIRQGAIILLWTAYANGWTPVARI